MTLSPFEKLQDMAESVGGSAVRADRPMFADSTRLVPTVTVTYETKAMTITRPTLRQCAERGEEWLRDVAK